MVKTKQVLVIAPHMDDEVLGCAGTIRRHAINGDFVTVCIVANRAYAHKYNPKLINREKKACLAAQKILGYQKLIFLDLPDEKLDQSQIRIITALEAVAGRVLPDIAYIPHRGDRNQDHRAVFKAARVVFRTYSDFDRCVLRVYETPSSTDTTPTFSEWQFLPNYYVDINKTLESKIKAMACYKNESKTFPHPRSAEGLKVYAQKRGMEVRMRAAEAFVIMRDYWEQK